jgi:hypothetical protein
MTDYLNKAIAFTRVKNAERRLLVAQDDYERQVAKVQLDEALRHLEAIRGAEHG